MTAAYTHNLSSVNMDCSRYPQIAATIYIFLYVIYKGTGVHPKFPLRNANEYRIGSQLVLRQMTIGKKLVSGMTTNMKQCTWTSKAVLTLQEQGELTFTP